jgi:hypothetical protein
MDPDASHNKMGFSFFETSTIRVGPFFTADETGRNLLHRPHFIQMFRRMMNKTVPHLQSHQPGEFNFLICLDGCWIYNSIISLF